MGQAKNRGTREQREAEALEREASAPAVDLPLQLNCQKCGQSMPVKWKSVSRQHSAYRGTSTCSACKAYAVHMVGDPKFLEQYSTGPASLHAEQVDLFGKTADGDIVHVYSSDHGSGTHH